MTFEPFDRAVRAAFVGLGRIYDLNIRAYVDNPDVEVVALVDPSEERRVQRQADWPAARTFASVAELAASGLEVDAVEALLPIPLHVEGVTSSSATDGTSTCRSRCATTWTTPDGSSTRPRPPTASCG